MGWPPWRSSTAPRSLRQRDSRPDGLSNHGFEGSRLRLGVGGGGLGAAGRALLLGYSEGFTGDAPRRGVAPAPGAARRPRPPPDRRPPRERHLASRRLWPAGLPPRGRLGSGGRLGDGLPAPDAVPTAISGAGSVEVGSAAVSAMAGPRPTRRPDVRHRRASVAALRRLESRRLESRLVLGPEVGPRQFVGDQQAVTAALARSFI